MLSWVTSITMILIGGACIGHGFRLIRRSTLDEFKTAKVEGRSPREDVIQDILFGIRTSNYWFGFGLFAVAVGGFILMNAHV